ncbi:MAG: ABC transporter permease [Gemmatimonadota bacterium]
MHSLLKDAQYALRTLMRNPAFAAAAVLTLALGVGANTAIFSVVNGVLLRPLPYPAAERLHVVWNNNTREGIERDITSWPNFIDWRDRSEVFAALAGYSAGNTALTGAGDPEQVPTAFVTAGFFDVLGVNPVLGRQFSEAELQPGATPVVLLSDGLWQSRFGGDRGIVGRDVILNGSARTVIGVMPPAFDYPAEAQLWLPLAPEGNLAASRGALWLSVVGRLRDDLPIVLAQSRMDDLAAQLQDQYPTQNTGSGILLEPLHATITGDVRTPLLVLLGAVAVVLLIGCANVANLLLARGAVRRKELAVRIALGAGRRRMARQLLTESVVLGVVGGAAGMLLAAWAVSALVAMAPPELPRLENVHVDGAVLAFALFISAATGLLFGIAPLLQAGRTELMTTLREGGREAVAGEGIGRLRPVLISTQIGLALVLLVGAGLLIRSFVALNAVDPGFDTRGALTFRVVLPGARYDTPERMHTFHRELIRRISGIPGVRSAGGASTLFLARLPNMGPILREGDPPVADDEQRESVVLERATPGFFDAMGMTLTRGRGLADTDVAAGTAVGVVNQAFARRYYPDSDPVGRRFTFGSAQDSTANWIEIAGVVADALRSGLAAAPRPEVYLPHAQAPTAGLTIVARADRDPLSLLPAVRSAVAGLDGQLPISAVQTLEQSLAEQLAARRFIMNLLATFAALAALLASIGIYGVVSYLVTQRIRELGVRRALGATHADVMRLVISQSLRHVLPGLGLGVLAALALSRIMASQLFGVSPTDPLTFLAVTAGLLAVAAGATYVPARRAAGVEPNTALRQD